VIAMAWRRRRLAAAALAAAIVATPCLAAGAVEVVVTNLRSSEGNVHAELCTEREFLKPCHYAADAPAKAGTTVVVVRDVPPGRYAIVAYHDRNANGKADVNFIGLPTEDVGFSNGALKGLVKPKFSDAAIDHGADNQRISLALRKF
jgi:uncharacterized protein (DUF2141 family)